MSPFLTPFLCFECRFGDLVFKASSVTPPESGEGPTMITCTVPPQVFSAPS